MPPQYFWGDHVSSTGLGRGAGWHPVYVWHHFARRPGYYFDNNEHGCDCDKRKSRRWRRVLSNIEGPWPRDRWHDWIALFLDLCVACSMYIIGFCDTLLDNLKVCPNAYDEFGKLTQCDGDAVKFTFFGCKGSSCAAMTLAQHSILKMNDKRFWGIILATILLIMALIGTGWVIKMQLGLMLLLTLTILSFHVGSFVHDPERDIQAGFVGWGSDVYEVNATTGNLTSTGESNLYANLWEGYTSETVGGVEKQYGFFSVFAIFFPAVTGIMAGANISGLLRDPSRNIVKGTFWAIGVSTVVYLIMAFFVGAVCSRIALQNDLFIMMKVELIKTYEPAIGWMVLAGVYAATFSSALASLVGAPQMLFSVAKDFILPVDLFATTHRADYGGCCSKRDGCCNRRVCFGCYKRVDAHLEENSGDIVYSDADGEAVDEPGDPILGYFVAFGIAVACILVGDLNVVAPLISMFFMLTYGLINVSCFALSYYRTPGWRPEFHFFHWSGALLGAALCLTAMFLTDVTYTALSLLVAFVLWLYILKREVHRNWGTVFDGLRQKNAMTKLMHLRHLLATPRRFVPSFYFCAAA